MKKIIIAIVLFNLLACDKEKDCLELIKGKPDNHLISNQELTNTKSLFNSNNISFNDYQFYKFQKDDYGNYHIRCHQFINNLKVFTGDLIFHFTAEGHTYSPTGTIIESIDIGVEPNMELHDAKSIFLKTVEEDDAYSGNKENIENGCLSCELGYYDLNAGTSYSTADYTLAWKIAPDQTQLPFAYINDADKTLIYYDNGIRY